MNTLVFYSEKGYVGVEQAIVSALNNMLKYRSESSRLINTVFTDNLKNIALTDFILILTGPIKHGMVKHIDRSAHVVVNANDRRALKRLIGCKANIYTCGFSAKDFVTFSSREDNAAMVSLQRNIRLKNHRIYEPFEIMCEIATDVSDYAILAAVLTMILLDLVDDECVSGKICI